MDTVLHLAGNPSPSATWTELQAANITGTYHLFVDADGYVFAVLTATEHARYDALDPDQWSFWVLPRQVVAAPGQRSLGLARVKALAGPPVSYADLADRIREVVVPTEA